MPCALRGRAHEDMLRMLVTGGPPVRRGGKPRRIDAIPRPASVSRITGAGSSGNTPAAAGRHHQYQ